MRWYLALAIARALVVSPPCRPPRVRAVVSAAVPSGLTESRSNVESIDLKKALLRAVGNENRSEKEILYAAAALEALKVRTAPVSGRWALVFSTQTARPKESAAKSIMDLPQEVSNAIYSVLFKVAPFLAGGQERRRQKAFSVANEQTVDEAEGTVDNRVTRDACVEHKRGTP